MTAPVFRLPDRPIRVAPPGSGIWAGPLSALVVSHRRPDGSVARATWSVGRAWPIQLGSTPGDIVGVTAGDGLVAMPLDAKLSWLVLSEEERAALLAALQTG